MAIIEKMPSKAVIDGYKGVLDFYQYKELACVRSWPSAPTLPRSAPVQAQWPAFRYINQHAQDISQSVLEAYQRMASGTGLVWKDYLVRGYLHGISY